MTDNNQTVTLNNGMEQRLTRLIHSIEPNPRFIGQLKDQLVHYYDDHKRYERSSLVIIFGVLAFTASLFLLFWRKSADKKNKE